ncbi:leukocyte elastase inhibitor-like [Cydia splendana]|uniref:leukocyte elastase inhibitor-like n=1 Tax=Cydia splendana TaxID=1100963 RepID=UPI0021249123
MNRVILCGVFLACLRSLECMDNSRPDNTRLNYFDTDLLRYTTEDRSGNVVVSPASIRSTLAMLLEGASGNTEAEIRSSLRLSPNKNEFREQLNVYLSALQFNTTAAKLQNANGVFVSNKFKLKKEYEKVIEKVYLTKVVSLNFLDPVGSAATVNDWVGNQTRGLIRSLIEPAHIPPSSDVLLINSLYFKSAWQHAFDRSLTRSACFRVQGSCKKQVSMMEISTELNYAFVDNLRAHAVELPYEGGRYSMVLLVPQDHDGLAGLIRDLPYMSLPQVCKMMEPSHVQLSLPRFTVDYSEDMVGPLRSMRITTLFSSKSNLSGIIEGGPAQINHLYHRVYISVDEDGTVAAAASAALVVPLIQGSVQLVVDKPFVFFIKDNHFGLVLFEGKIEEPHEYVAPEKNSENNVVKSSRNSYGIRF